MSDKVLRVAYYLDQYIEDIYGALDIGVVPKSQNISKALQDVLSTFFQNLKNLFQ